MFTKDFFSLTSADFAELIDNAVSEGRQLDYKEKFQIQSESERKEFLADISSFANSVGGIIIFGIEEERDSQTGKPTGIPKAAHGLEGFNADAEILRLESMIRDGLAPRLSGVLMRKIEGFTKGPLLLIKIPQSWASPHMLTFQTKSPFFERGNAGKYPMDISQIRSSFLLLDSLSEKVKNFHQDRVAKVLSGNGPIDVRGNRKLILHILPLAAFRGENQISIETMRQYETNLAPLTSHGYNTKVNIDGMVTYLQTAQANLGLSYAQIFRNGTIELVDTGVFGDQTLDNIPSIAFERQSINGINRFLKFLLSVGFQSSAALLVTLSGVKGLKLGFGSSHFIFPGTEPKTFDRDVLSLPDVVVEDLNTPADQLLRPVFDTLYNAAGWDKCMNYNAEGKWEPRT